LDASATAAQPKEKDVSLGGPYAWFVVFVLCLASIVGYVDRQIINLLVDPIKVDLGINDTQIGILQGFSFVLIYALLAIPIAWLADFGKRTTVIIAGILCWSLATFSCGLATTFILMFIARAFVGMGEVTLSPSGYSLIGDYFPKERVGLAISFFTGSGFLGSGLAYMIGGAIVGALSDHESYVLPLLGELKPWQLVFMIVAIPGLLLALIMLLVKEPPRRSVVETEAIQSARQSFAALFRHIRQHLRLFTGLIIGFSLMAAATYAIVSWVPAFLSRVHDWSPERVGAQFGIVLLIASTGGVFAGGFIASELMRRGIAAANVIVAVVAGLLAIVFAVAYPLVPSGQFALILLAPALFFAAMPFGCGTATLPLVTPNRLRAQVVAIYLLVANLLGLTLGPTGVGLITDFVFRDPNMINVSLAIAAPVLLLIGALTASIAIAPYKQLIEASED
jgi:MFS family permease